MEASTMSGSVFPSEFSHFCGDRHRTLSRRIPAARRQLSGRRFAWMADVFHRSAVERAVRQLDRRIAPLLSSYSHPIDADSIRQMRCNYTEMLNKNMRLKTTFMGERSRAHRVAKDMGLVRMMQSESLVRTAETVTGFTLRRSSTLQVICYGPGDYTGPHNDHHPEDPDFCDGYVDVQLTLIGPGVAQQSLVYENDGYLTEVAEVGQAGMAIYHLPFWHYTTPLVPRQRTARRWVLLATFAIERNGRKERHRR